jgi:hypothetical protein
MASIGKHHHLNVAHELRAQTQALYQTVLGASKGATGGAAIAPDPDLEVFTFENGASIGVFYVSSDQTLTPEQHMNAIWLEFFVDDVAQTTEALAGLGIEPFKYEDGAHPYFQAPGGQVFRLAREAS